MSAIFSARYPGTCSSCGERINPDDACTWSGDEIVHGDCKSVGEQRAAVVCPECWISKPCFCDVEGPS